MQMVALIWGMLAFLGMIVAFTPLLGILNWINIPFAAIGLVLSLIALLQSGVNKRGGAIVGLACCAAAVWIGVLRLKLGFGIL
jgi:hypothetical protein